MILSDVFQRFVEESPVCVMAQALLENALPPATVDALFRQHACEQYTRKLLFSDIVNLMSLVVCRIRPSINSAYKKLAGTLGVTRKAVYDKINHVETTVSAALVRHTADRLGQVIDALGGRRQTWLAGYRVQILDGSHLPGTEHRLQPLRTTRAGALPGQALVVLNPEAMLVGNVFPCEDGHAQERALTDAVLATVQAGELWLGDRNFCTTPLLFGIARRGAAFVIRQHGSTLHWQAVGPRIAQGRSSTGQVFEQAVQLTDEQGQVLQVRRITIELDQPTRDGDRQIHILTNLPPAEADALAVAALYAKRWTLETAFQELEATLHGEIATLGYPRAALFAFCVALAAYNVLSTVKAALRSVQGPAVVDTELSGYDVAEEVSGTYRGMLVAIPPPEWQVFQELSPPALGAFLQRLARAVRLAEFRKQPRGPKKPRPRQQSGAKIKHVATAKLLKTHKARPRRDQPKT
jgi:IS4 transposase